MTINHIYKPRALLRKFSPGNAGAAAAERWRRRKRRRRRKKKPKDLHTHSHAALKVFSANMRIECVCARRVRRSIKVEIYKTEPGGAIHAGRNGWRPARYVRAMVYIYMYIYKVYTLYIFYISFSYRMYMYLFIYIRV